METPAARTWPAVVTALGLALAFVLARWAVAAHGDLSRFALVGTALADPAAVPAGVHVAPGAGYDGQFYLRFALDPAHLDGRVGGIALDTPLRRQRIGYPVEAWLLSYGNARAAVVALVVVNVAAVGVLARQGAVLARERGRNPFWGLVLVAFVGFTATLGRDLTELTEAALLVTGLLCARRERWVVAGLAFAGAVLTRESAVLVPLAFALARLTHPRPSRTDVVWVLPGVAYGAWEVVNRLRYGTFPLAGEASNGSTPGSAFLHALRTWATHPSREHALDLGAVAGLVLVVVAAATAWRQVERYVLLALVLEVVLALTLSGDVWNGDLSELRVLAEVHVLAAWVLLHAPRPRLGAATAVTASLTGLFVLQGVVNL